MEALRCTASRLTALLAPPGVAAGRGLGSVAAEGTRRAGAGSSKVRLSLVKAGDRVWVCGVGTKLP
jgi:hypothetical protein